MAKKKKNGDAGNKQAVGKILTEGKIKKKNKNKGWKGKKGAANKAVKEETSNEGNKEAGGKVLTQGKRKKKKKWNWKGKKEGGTNKGSNEAVIKVEEGGMNKGLGGKETVNIRVSKGEDVKSEVKAVMSQLLAGVGKKKKRRRRKKKKKNVQELNGNKDVMKENVDGIKKELEDDRLKIKAATDSSNTKMDDEGNNGTEQGKKGKKRKREQDGIKEDGIKMESATKTEDEGNGATKPAGKDKKRKPDNNGNQEDKEEKEGGGKKDKNKCDKAGNNEKKTGVKKNKMEDKSPIPILHPAITSCESKDKIRSVWVSAKKEGIVLQEGDIEVIKNPFTCCYIHNLLENEQFLKGLKEELNQIELLPKNNDLYKFHQTPDLRKVTTPFISKLRSLLYNDVRQWLMDVTGLPLTDTVDMGSSRYAHTDVLLCHDDELEGRSIAFILYLVPPWNKEDGGSLDLFNTDGNGDPKDVVRSLVPEHNGFAFFQVSPVSFHQVSEVVAKDKTRLSINGWFHGPTRTVPKCPAFTSSKPCTALDFEEDNFYAWMNPIYLDMETQKEIRGKFGEESAIELENFLSDEAYEKLSQAFKGEDLTWERTYPANKRFYEVLATDNMSPEIKECQEFLKSEAFFLVLSQLTGLKLHHLAPPDSEEEEEEPGVSNSDPSTPTCHMEAQRWQHKCYTLVRDSKNTRQALDAFLFANVSDKWTEDLGGHITYIAKHEEEEILTVAPTSNCLSLVYRDPHTLRFTKYINATSLRLGLDASSYHSFGCVYYE